jgi:serine/threonine protein kinase
MADVTHFGRYELRGLVGSGGMGEVYEAFDREQHRTVALKLLPTPLASDEGFVERFRRESFAAAQLNDPHVIPIHRYGDIDGRLYIDMRLVKGLDLAGVLERDGPLEASRAVSFISQAAEALDAAHAANLIHRDVKPSNLLVTPGDFVYLVDFGIAHVFGMGTTGKALTATGATIGTLDYMAPERFIGKTEVDSRTDVYSLTCVLYECLTGSRPFPVEGLPALLHAHLNTPAPRPSLQRPDLPAALDDVIARGMAKDPDDRYPTTGDLAQDATHALRGTATGQVTRTIPWVPPVRPAPATAQQARATPPPQYRSANDAPPPPLPAPTYASAGAMGTPPSAPLTFLPGFATPPPGGTPLPGYPPGGGYPPGPLNPAGPPSEPRKRNTGWIVAAAVLVVTAIAGVVIVSRLALGSTTASPPSESEMSTGPSAASSAAAPSSASTAPAVSTPPQTVIVTQTATQTVLPPAPTTAQPAPAARGAGDLGLGTPIQNIGCTGQYLVFVGSATSPSGYSSDIQSYLDSYPNSSYLRTDASCPSLERSTSSGNAIYSVFLGPFTGQDPACDVRAQVGGGAYVKVMNDIEPSAARIQC